MLTKRLLGVRLNEALRERVRALAFAQRRPVTSVVEEALTAWADRQETPAEALQRIGAATAAASGTVYADPVSGVKDLQYERED